MTVFHNPLILSALLAMVVAQVSKVLLILITERRFVPDRMAETGGMPSSHSSTVAAMATSAGLNYGVNSPVFAISLILGIIVIYDATGVRRAAGRHAEILNELMEEFSHLFEEEKRPKALKTLLGHTYPQVLVGSGIGLGMGYAVQNILNLG